MADSIGETDRRAGDLAEQLLPSGGLNAPLQSAISQSRAMGSTGGQRAQIQMQSGDLIDQAIAARQGIEARRAALVNQLPYSNRRQGIAIAAELHGLDKSEQSLRWEANQRRMMAHQEASEVDRRLKLDRDTSIDEQGAGMMQALGYLEGALRNGRISQQQHDDALLEAGQRFPMALRHPEAAKHYDFAITQADRLNQFTARNLERQAGKIAGKYGVEVQTDPDTGLPSIPLTQEAALQTDKAKDEHLRASYGITLDHIRQPTQVAVGNIDPQTGFTGDEKGNVVALDTGKRTKDGHPIPAYLPKAEYLNYGGTLAPESMGAPAAAPAVPQSAPTHDPRIDLANRALNDPQASEEHKAAARKILGIAENGK